MHYTVSEAKQNLARLLKEASAGQEVTITRRGKPVARLVGIVGMPKKRVAGRLVGKISYSRDAFAPLTDDELDELGFP
jgi:prevent-host-death family protein